MKKTEWLKKKLIVMIMMVVMAATLLSSGTLTADAATAMGNVSIICYLKGNSRANTYKSINGAYSGYIDVNDQCTILAVYDNGWVKVSYPVGNNKTKTAYTQSSNFFVNTNFSTSKVNAGSNYTVYKKSNMVSKLGSVYGSDNVILVGTENGRQQIIYPLTGTSNQYKMGFINGTISATSPVSITTSTANIKNGTYFIESALKSNMVLDVSGVSTDDGANIYIWNNCNGDNQKFNITKSGNYYTITAVHSGKAVDVYGASAASGTNVNQWTSNNTNAQKWIITDAGNGYYYIISALGTYLDVNGAGTANGTNVQAYTGNKTDAQKWKLISTSASNVYSSKLLFPLKGSITRSSSLKTNGQYCDYRTGGSVAVYAPADGTVVYKQAYRNSSGTKKLSSYGNYIEFKSSDGVYTVKCCHLSSFNGVSTAVNSSLSYPCSGSDSTLTLKTKSVKQGELLGYTGMTGNASGHHLHLEVYKNGKAVNPASVFTTWN